MALIREAIEGAGIEANVEVARDGEQATDFIDRVDRETSMTAPAVIVLDINLPRKNGAEVLVHIRKSHRSRNARVLVVSTSRAASDRDRMNALGADDYFQKPNAYEAFMKLGERVRDLLK